MKRLAIICTHPIQYYAPLFRMLALRKKIDIKVFYTLGESGKQNIQDKDFGSSITWDIPLLNDYSYQFQINSAKRPNTDKFFGIITPSLIREVNSFKPDALLIFGWNFYSHLKCIRFFKGKCQILFRGDSNLIDQKSEIKSFLRKLVLRILYTYIDKALYVGKQNRFYYISAGLKKNQLIFAPHAVDNDRFYDSTERKYENSAQRLRDSFGYKAHHLVFIFVAKFIDKKDPLILIRAFKQIQNQDIRLLLVGSGPLDAILKHESSSDSRISVIGFVNQTQIPVIYRVGDVFVLPSKGPFETWGLAINEAMACSRPVIVSDKVGCAEDLVQYGINGFIFKSGDDADLERVLQLIISKKPYLKEMGNQSMKIVKEWSYEKICTAIENIVIDSKLK